MYPYNIAVFMDRGFRSCFELCKDDWVFISETTVSAVDEPEEAVVEDNKTNEEAKSSKAVSQLGIKYRVLN